MVDTGECSKEATGAPNPGVAGSIPAVRAILNVFVAGVWYGYHFIHYLWRKL